MCTVSINGLCRLAQDARVGDVAAMNVIDKAVSAMIEHKKLITHRTDYA